MAARERATTRRASPAASLGRPDGGPRLRPSRSPPPTTRAAAAESPPPATTHRTSRDVLGAEMSASTLMGLFARNPGPRPHTALTHAAAGMAPTDSTPTITGRTSVAGIMAPTPPSTRRRPS
ncbi:hypothetical protein LV779_15620 [Streptomyces thinghirensis]|nr:hypothetical protein [Streptomyces thinghirensis]